ncbi:unnamed protein product [Pelagomonas calceolata]|uniref:Uncharacterized protein n=1 Tax=Pelagomonas calceolata TaxID=35677 RepID=A0A8J2WPL7_9STRA|nr:unnamed protein product [Pelagomonas calceolata]
MDPTVAAPTLGGLGGLPPPGVDEVVTTGYAGGPLGVALPPPASSDIGLGALGPPNDPPVPPGAASLGGLPLGAAAPGMQPPPSAFGPTSLSEAVSHRLDAGALRALAELETAEADAIAQRLEQAGATVRNPSAYVHRAVNNARRRGTQAPPYGQPGGAYGGGAAAGQLDQNALSALQELPQEQATSILDELASKGAGVRNPSAYVVKAVGNARRQLEGGGRFYGGGPPGGPPRGYGGGGYGRPPMHGQPPAPRGYGAPQQPFGPTGQQLDYPGGHYYEHHAAPPPSQPFDTDAAVAAEYAHLDQKAVAALQALPALQSTQILLELRRKRGAIRNPSAYVMRATANAAAGTVPDTARSPQYAQYHQQQQQQQYQYDPSQQQYGQPPAPADQQAAYQQQQYAQYGPPAGYAAAPGAAPGAAPDYAAYADAEAAYAAYAAGGQPAAYAQPGSAPGAPEPGA